MFGFFKLKNISPPVQDVVEHIKNGELNIKGKFTFGNYKYTLTLLPMDIEVNLTLEDGCLLSEAHIHTKENSFKTTKDEARLLLKTIRERISLEDSEKSEKARKEIQKLFETDKNI